MQSVQSAQLLESQASCWSILLRLMTLTRGASTNSLAHSIASKLQMASAKQRERERLVYLHRALKSHLLGGHYAAVKKAAPHRYNALRKVAEDRARLGLKQRLKLRYLASLQLPAWGECDEEQRARERLAHVLRAKRAALEQQASGGHSRGVGGVVNGPEASLVRGASTVISRKIGDQVLRRRAY